MVTGSIRLSFCPTPFGVLGGIPAREPGFGKTIFPLSVSENMAVRNLAISSSFAIPFAAIFAERVRRGITTPSKTRSAFLARILLAIAFSLLCRTAAQAYNKKQLQRQHSEDLLGRRFGSANGDRTRTLSLERAAC
jgi:hypothetical protein